AFIICLLFLFLSRLYADSVCVVCRTGDVVPVFLGGKELSQSSHTYIDRGEFPQCDSGGPGFGAIASINQELLVLFYFAIFRSLRRAVQSGDVPVQSWRTATYARAICGAG